MNDKKSKRLSVRMTESEHFTLREYCKTKGITVSKLLRLAMTRGESLTKDFEDNKIVHVHKVDKALIYELNKIGVNINQIAKNLNQFSDINQISLLTELSKLNEKLSIIEEQHAS